MKTTEYICDMCGEEAKEYGTGPAYGDSLVILSASMPENGIFTPSGNERYHLHNRCWGKLLKKLTVRKPPKAIVDPYEMAVDIAARRSG